MGVVQQIGAEAKVGLLPVGPGASQGAGMRSSLPCAVAVRGRSVDEVMQALTVITGDPWDYWQETHLLCFTGHPLTGPQRAFVGSTVASSRFKRGITAAQRRLIDSDRGLQYSDLTLRQKGDLAQATSQMRSRVGAGIEGLVLRRNPAAPHLAPNPYADVYVSSPNGSTRLGSIRLF